MLAKHVLLASLQNGLEAEEKAISIYTTHLKSALFWTEIDKKGAAFIKESLSRLASDSERHKTIIESLITEIRKDSRNAF
ncbi:MAG: hypothetical protein HQ579_03625 [Candidatus Omnitrophica bacterium]|nr:hypothetical protein [Candidatus Omnitrophota bacterium]